MWNISETKEHKSVAGSNPCARYHITIPKDEKHTAPIIAAELKQWASNWAFQLEKSDTGYIHWQVELSLTKKRRLQEIVNKLKTTVLRGHMSISSTNSGQKEFSYAMKADSRIEGPWTDKDEVLEIPREVRDFKMDRTWQQKIIKKIMEMIEDRWVNLLYDPIGGTGKSSLLKYLSWHKICQNVPPFNDVDKMMGWTCSLPPAKAYTIDMPRALEKKKLKAFWAGIENLKTGKMHDWRYKARERIISSPQVWVFTNRLPDYDCLSDDRWKIWMVDSVGNLCKYKPERMTKLIAKRKLEAAEKKKVESSDDECAEDDYPRNVKQKV